MVPAVVTLSLRMARQFGRMGGTALLKRARCLPRLLRFAMKMTPWAHKHRASGT
jgi:hypothetical protein